MIQKVRKFITADSQHRERLLHVVSPNELDSETTSAWERLRRSNPDLASPFFDLEFTKAVAAVRNDVRVAFLKSDNSVVEIASFQSSGRDCIVPVGGRLNDIQGILTEPGRPSRLIQETLKQQGISAFCFNASKSTAGSSPCKFSDMDSYHLDLSIGWDGYFDWVCRHSSTVARQAQKTRALARDVGPVRFEFDIRDTCVLEQLIRFKSAKYRRIGTFDILSVDWTSRLLRDIFNRRKPGFQGVLSGLWAGQELVSVHFGMLTQKMLHYWFPAYHPAFAKYSPGTELLLRVAEHAAQRGIEKLDLGSGDDPYKNKFCNGREMLCCGEITSSRWAFEIAKRKHQLRKRLGQMPMKPIAKKLLRLIYPGFGQWNFR